MLFTSSNGVRAFAELSPRRDLPAFAVGDATAAAALAAGFTQFKSAGGDVRDLARLVASSLKPADGLLFHVRAVRRHAAWTEERRERSLADRSPPVTRIGKPVSRASRAP